MMDIILRSPEGDLTIPGPDAEEKADAYRTLAKRFGCSVREVHQRGKEEMVEAMRPPYDDRCWCPEVAWMMFDADVDDVLLWTPTGILTPEHLLVISQRMHKTVSRALLRERDPRECEPLWDWLHILEPRIAQLHALLKRRAKRARWRGEAARRRDQ